MEGGQNFTNFQSSLLSPVYSLKAIYGNRHFQVGVSGGYCDIAYKGMNIPSPLWGFADATEEQYNERLIPLKLFANSVVHFRHLEAYGGVSAGGQFNITTYKIIFPPSWGDQKTVSASNFVAGIQLGANWFFTRHIGINGEVSGENEHFGSGPLDHNQFSAQVNVGARYKF